MRTKVIIIEKYSGQGPEIGKEGYIDGYFEANAIVIVDGNAHFIPFHFFRAIGLIKG